MVILELWGKLFWFFHSRQSCLATSQPKKTMQESYTMVTLSLEWRWHQVWAAAVEMRVAMAAARASFLPSQRCSDTSSSFYGNKPNGGSMKKGLCVLWHGGNWKWILGTWRATLPHVKGKWHHHFRMVPTSGVLEISVFLSLFSLKVHLLPFYIRTI